MTINPIETVYRGYRFRSRLEARWAVFFETLRIEYRYEHEGYILGDIPYLPDFYLPQTDEFIEIKGKEPNEVELQKARRLALFTGKGVYIIYGNIGFPDEEYSHRMKAINPPTLFRRKKAPGHTALNIEPCVEVLDILQRLHEVGIAIHATGYGEFWFDENIPPDTLDAKYLQRVADSLQKQAETIQDIAPYIEQYKDELEQALSVRQDEVVVFQEQVVFDGCAWTECEACGEIVIGVEAIPHNRCPRATHPLEEGIFRINSPRLIEAYTAARSARFEHGEQG